MTDLLVVLQNPWGKPRPNRVWLRALWASHTGKRLCEMLPPDRDIEIVNANPAWGTHASARFPPDLSHLRQTIQRHGPRVILGCGRIAQQGLDTLGIDHYKAPHPAWRALTHERTAQIRTDLEAMLR